MCYINSNSNNEDKRKTSIIYFKDRENEGMKDGGDLSDIRTKSDH